MSLLGRLIAVEGERLERRGRRAGRRAVQPRRAAWAPGWASSTWPRPSPPGRGWQARQLGQQPRIGLLLGTRRYRCSVARFAAGQRLQVDIERGYQADNGLGQFDCRIHADGAELASATLTVFGPEDPSAFLNGETV